MFNNPIYESAFKQLDLLVEQDFNLNSDPIEDIKNFVDEAEVEKDIDVIDLDAENENELDASNIGKIVLQCPCCETIICKNADEIELPDDCEEAECMVQVGEQCPVCFSEEGYKIIGKVAPYEEVEVEIEHKEEPAVKIDGNEVDFNEDGKAEIEVTPDEDGKVEVELVPNTEESEDEENTEDIEDDDTDDEMETDFDDSEPDVEAEADDTEADDEEEDEKKKNESLTEATSAVCPDCGKNPCECNKKECKESLDEGLNDINLETETDRISIHAEQKAEAGEEMIAPLDFQAANEIVDSQPSDAEADDYLDGIDTADEAPTEEPVIDTESVPSEEDIDIEDVDEKALDGLGESYFKNVYDNVTSYITESIHEKDGKLIVEGIITFDSAVQKRTQFVLEGNTISSTGKCSMLAENLQITPGTKAFNICGTLADGKFIAESLSYDYEANGTRVNGSINITE